MTTAIQIYKDLEGVGKDKYKIEYITLATYMSHSTNYKDVVQVLKKYGCDVKKFNDLLWNEIPNEQADIKREFDRWRSENRYRHQRSRYHQRGNGTTIADFFSEIFPPEEYSEERMTPLEHKLLVDLLNTAQRKEHLKQQEEMSRDPQSIMAAQNGISARNASFHTFLEIVLRGKSQDKSILWVVEALEKSGFDTARFLKALENNSFNNAEILSKMCVDLTAKAEEGKLKAVIGRDVEVEQVLTILKKAEKNSPILVGKAGVGKTAIAEGLALKIYEGDVPEELKGARIFKLEMIDILKDTQFRGAFEKNVSELLKVFKSMEENEDIVPILFIDEIHTIMGAGGNEGNNFSNFIKPALARGELRTIGATTTDEYHKFIKKDGALDRRFVPVTVKEPNFEETKQIVEGSLSYFENAHKLRYGKGVIAKAIELTNEFVVDRAQPDKTFDLVDYAGAKCHIEGKKTVNIEDLERAMSKQKNISLDAILTQKKNKTRPVVDILSETIVGQDEAVSKVAKLIERDFAGFKRRNKPIASLLFAGTTGTGKTELARQVANVLKADLEILDMSEYMEKHSVAKLIGAPPGYVGSDLGSPLTKKLTESPRVVLLLDEVEKAHKDVLNILLQAMDRGVIKDSQGKIISFKNVFIIMTTNAGAEELSKSSIGLAQMDNKVSKSKKSIEGYFAPELIGRLNYNAPIVFNNLSKDVMVNIARKELAVLEAELLTPKNISLEMEDEVYNSIVEEAYLRNKGARPIKDLLESLILDELTLSERRGELNKIRNKEGDKTIKVLVKKKKDKIEFVYS